MLHFYPNPAWPGKVHGRITFYENGRDVGVRMAYAHDALIGIRLCVPRVLGCAAARLHLLRDGEDTPVFFPLRYCGSERGSDLYAVLLDGATLSDCGHLYFGKLVIDCIYGQLYAMCGEAGEVCFSRDGQGTEFALLFAENAYPIADAPTGGALYALPLCELTRLGRLFRGEDNDYDTFFLHLRTLGVRALWLCPPAADAPDDGRWNPSQLPPAFLLSAERHGIHLLFDLLCCSSVRDDGNLLSHADRLPFTAPGEGVDDRPGFWNMPVLLENGQPLSLESYFCGSDGVVAQAVQGGARGMVVREADRFGDALLSAIRICLGTGLLLGAVEGGAAPIMLGTRRRYLFDGTLCGLIGKELRRACLSFLIDRDTAPLAHYFGHVLAGLPSFALHMQAHGLSFFDEGSFLSAVTERLYQEQTVAEEENPYALAELGHLIAGTLPGIPLYLAGEENGLPYPPVEGEAVGGQLAFFLRLGQLRKKETVYRDGAFRLLHLSPDLLVFSRERQGEALLTVINRSTERLTVASPDGFSVVFGGRGLKNLFGLRPMCGIVIKVARWEGEVCRLRFTREGRQTACTTVALAKEVYPIIVK